MIYLGGLKTIRGFYIRNFLDEEGGGGTRTLLIEFSEDLWSWADVHVETVELDQAGQNETQYFPVIKADADADADMKIVAAYVSLSVLESSGQNGTAGIHYFSVVEEDQDQGAESYQGKQQYLSHFPSGNLEYIL